MGTVDGMGRVRTTRATLRGLLRRGSIRGRILRGALLAASVVLVVTTVAFAYTLDRILATTAMNAARSQAAQVSSQVVAQPARAATVLASVPTQGAILQLVESDGTVRATSSSVAAHRPVSRLRPTAGQTLTAQVDGIPQDPHDPYAVVAVGLSRQVANGATVLLVAVPLQFETTLVKGAAGILAVLALALLSWLVWLINRVIGSVLRPVEQIRSSVATIRTSGSEARVPVPSGDDEITALAITMNQMLERLEKADASQRSFVSNASHELRSPLTTVRAIAETSPRGLDPEQTQVVVAEVVRMQGMVDDLLTLAKADDNGLRLVQQDVDVDELVMAEVRRLRAATPLQVTSTVEPARVTGDELRLGQVLQNLTDNATRHARSSIRLACAVDGTDVVVTVDNDGDPITPGSREAVFDRFVRLQEARDRDTGGSGLGLAIVRAVVTAQGGSVTATEAADGWCRFRVALPAQVAEVEDQDQLG